MSQDCDACPAVTLTFGGAAVCLRAIQITMSDRVQLKTLKCIAQPVHRGLTARTVLMVRVSSTDKQLFQIAEDDDILYESITLFPFAAGVTLSYLEVYGEVYLPRV
jgi:hypothetical protein